MTNWSPDTLMALCLVATAVMVAAALAAAWLSRHEPWMGATGGHAETWAERRARRHEWADGE